MCSHGLPELDDDKSAASCHLARCRLIFKIFLFTNLMEVVWTTCSKYANIKVHQVRFELDEASRVDTCNCMDDKLASGKIYKLLQVCDVSGRVETEQSYIKYLIFWDHKWKYFLQVIYKPLVFNFQTVSVIVVFFYRPQKESGIAQL